MATEPLEGRDTRRATRPAESERGRESALLEAVSARDEEACRHLISLYYDSMIRLARGFVATEALAEEVVQDTWMAAFDGLSRFAGRSSFKTWLFRILIRKARATGLRESRVSALSELMGPSDECDPMETFFHSADHPEAGSWALPPQRWRRNPEDEALESELRRVIASAVRELPEPQRLVVNLRDSEGWDTEEIATLLDKTPNWVRVNLHRARAKIRLAINSRLGTRRPR